MAAKGHSGDGDGKCKDDYHISMLTPHGRVNAVKLLTLLQNLKENSLHLAKPSVFNNEMQMSAEDRINKLLHSREKFSSNNGESFRIFPRIVIFQNFYPGKEYKVPVTVRNSCKVMKPLHTIFEESQHFSITFSSGINTRIAPGMSTTITVHFTPEDKKDYSYKILLQTEKECSNIPIIAIGPRPLLDFPDAIYIPGGPIKIRSTKVVIVKNIGDVQGIFSLVTESPFEVEPKKGVLRPSEMMHIKVSVIPYQYGNLQGELKIAHETGEIIYSQLHAVGEEANVWMDKSDIIMEENYMGVKQVTSVTLHNDSAHLLSFKWKKFETTKEELLEYDKLMNGYSFLKNLEEPKYSKLSKGEVIDPTTHSQVFNRIYDDEIKAMKNEEFLFSHSSFSLKPLVGDIWPNSSIDITVIFEPKEPGKHNTVAYCDIPGHENRLPLSLRGIVKGPQFAFNLDTLDIDCVFVSKSHFYEIIVKNIGLIPGTIVFQQNQTAFGGHIYCNPEEISLLPEESRTLTLSFHSNVQGEFKESVYFKSQESGEIFKIDIKGSVIIPTLNFNEKEIDFGLVSVGFPTSYAILLQNLSMVPVSYRLGIKGDGLEPSISFKKYASLKEKPRIPKNPKEFLVTPAEGDVAPFSSVKVKVTLTPNVAREKKSSLTLSVVDAISTPMRLPIRHKSAIPKIVCTPNSINIRFCFLNYPYSRTVMLENHSDAIGFFHILPQAGSGHGPIEFSTPISQGIIKPRGERKIPLNIIINEFGKQSVFVSMLILGDDSPKEICSISGIGQGPVVTAEPSKLDYGQVNLLEYVTKDVMLTNDSPVPAEFSISYLKKNSPWCCTPDAGVLPSESFILLEVGLMLRDHGKYKDSLEIEILGSRTLHVALLSEGVGTNLVLEPSLYPTFDFGFVLTNQLIEKKFVITNEGTKFEVVNWSATDVFLQPNHNKKDKIEIPTVRTLFQFDPSTLNLTGRNSDEFVVRGYSEEPQTICEPFYGIVTLANKREIQLTTEVKAIFVDPKVAFSKPQLVFKINISSGQKFVILHETVNVRNVTDLTYDIELRTDFPFSLMGDKGPVQTLPIILCGLATIRLTVIFDSSCASNLHSKKYQNYLFVYYGDHPHIDLLPLYGEVNFPNVRIEPDIIDFGCIPHGCSVSKHIKMTNLGSFPINFSWFWLDAGTFEFTDEGKFREKEYGSESEKAYGEGNDEKSLAQRGGSPIDRNIELSDADQLEELSNLEEEEDSDKKRESAHKDDKDKEGDEHPEKDADKSLHGEDLSDSDGEKRLSKEASNEITDGELKSSLIPIVSLHFKEDAEEQALQSNPYNPDSEDCRNEYFGITPCVGQLGPYETLTISCRFSAHNYVNLSGILVAKITGGPTQTLFVKGRVSDLRLEISTTFVDAGYKIFCTPSYHVITLSNKGCLPFDFSFELDKEDILPSMVKNNNSGPKCIRFEPSKGFLDKKQKRQIRIEFYPGAVRKFEEPFQIVTGYLDPITITLKGHGVIPQIYAFLPRPKSYMTPPDIGFKAVDSLTTKKFPSKSDEDGSEEESEHESDTENESDTETESKEGKKKKKGKKSKDKNKDKNKDKSKSKSKSKNKDKKKKKKKKKKKSKKSDKNDDDDDDDDEGKKKKKKDDEGSSLFGRSIPDGEMNSLRDDGWEIITYQDSYPTVADIDLAIERTLTQDHLNKLSNMYVRSLPRNQSIPGLDAPPYSVDFGIVCVETTVAYSVLLYNYGPVPASARVRTVPKKSFVKNMGFVVKIPEVVKVNVDQTVSMQIIFNPLKLVYHKKQNFVHFTIYLEVFYGARIPLEVHAVVTVPYIVSLVEKVDFGSIKCGERKIMTILLANEGLVPCNWQAEARERRRGKPNPNNAALNKPNRRNSHPIFSFEASEFTLLPTQFTPVDVIFFPNGPGVKDGVFDIKMESNLASLLIPMVGEAVEPRVALSTSVIEFDSTLPCSDLEVKCITVRNPTAQPIEFFVPHLDSQLLEEERILRVLCDYYEKDHLCLPLRQPGEGLPKEIHQFYDTLVSLLNSMSRPEDSPPPSPKKKKKKIKKSSFRSPSAVESSRTTKSVTSGSSKTLSKQNPDHTERMLHENMPTLRANLRGSSNGDPVQAAHNAVISPTPTLEDFEPESGILLIFYGAPFTEYVYHAHRTANILHIKVLHIDDIIIEAAATAHSPESIKLRDKINSMYDEQDQSNNSGTDKDKKGKKDDKSEQNESLFSHDPVDEMTKKVHAILGDSSQGSTKKDSNRVSSGQPQSQVSNRRSGKKNTENAGLPGISNEVYEEVLRKRFMLPECQKGVLIDQLKSVFFESADAALTSLLRAASFMKYIHCFFFYNTFEKYATLHATEKKKEEEKALLENEDKKEALEKLTVEEADSLPEKDRALWEEIQMNKRKEDWKRKKELGPEEFQRQKREEEEKNTPASRQDRQSSSAKKRDGSKKSDDRESKKEKDGKGKKGKGKKKSKKKRKRSKSRKSKKKAKASTKDDTTEDEGDSIEFDEEMLALEPQFKAFESEYNDVLNISMNWDKKKGAVTATSPNSSARKSNKSVRGKSLSRGGLHKKLDTRSSETMKHNEEKTDDSVITWVFDCSKSDTTEEEVVAHLLNESDEFNACRSDANQGSKQLPTILHSCVPKPLDKEKIDCPDVFIFTSTPKEYLDDLLPEDAYPGSDTVSPKVSPLPESPVSKSGSPNQHRSQGKNDSSKTRWILNPREKVKLCIQFDPQIVGEYNCKCPIGVLGWDKRQYIDLQGICDIPRIDTDPHVLFDHVVSRKDPEKIYRLTYFLDNEYFDFGAVLTTKKDKRVHHIATSFNISNCSTLDAEVRFSFLDKTFEEVEAFEIEPLILRIQPGKTEKLTVFANPRSQAVSNETIICSITDNPMVEHIKISCSGVKVDFEVEPKLILFSHVLIFRKDFRIIKLKNKSLVPVIWHLVGLDDTFLEHFDLSSTEGLIMPLDYQDIRIEFFATQTVPCIKRTLKVHVYDEEGRGDPLCIESIIVNAESVDVLVDISFQDSHKNFVDFGNVKVGSEYSRGIYLKNKGKFDVKFRIEVEIPNNFRKYDLQKILSVSPAKGIIPRGEKVISVDALCHPAFDIHVYAVPVFKLYLSDGDTLVAIIPIQVSVTAHHCRFDIQPRPDLNFGAVAVGTKKILPLFVKNNGGWNITFNVMKDQRVFSEDFSVVNESLAGIISKASGVKEDLRSSSAKTKRSKRMTVACMHCGIFTVSPVMGSVAAGETAILQVECDMDAPGHFIETIKIAVPESVVSNKPPERVRLLAQGCYPTVNFSDIDSIFGEHYVCQSLTDLECPTDIKKHSIFVKDENKFLFPQTCLGEPTTAQLKLHNPGFVPCDLTATVIYSNIPKTVRFIDPTFSVTTSRFCIPPYENYYLQVVFNPPQIGSYNSILNIESATEVQNLKFSVNLSGEGNVPMISVTEPSIPQGSARGHIVFGPILLGRKNTHKLVIQNTGYIPCEVQLELSGTSEKYFSIFPSQESVHLMEDMKPDEPASNTLRCSLPHGSTASFDVRFAPNDVGKFTSIIKMYIIGNPYERTTIQCVGECYTEDITFDLPSITPSEEMNDDAVDFSDDPRYILEFGYCYIGQKKHIAFKINNHSHVMYRFVFPEGKIHFVPRIGHLKPLSSKEITATYTSTIETSSEEINIICRVHGIAYATGIPEGTSWDDRVTSVQWMEAKAEVSFASETDMDVLETDKHDAMKQKILKPELEPSHTDLPDAPFPIHLMSSATAGYASYSCSITKYNFEDTLMYQSREHTFTLRNSGNIPLSFIWNIIMDEHYPVRCSTDGTQCSMENLQTRKPETSIYSSPDDSSQQPSISVRSIRTVVRDAPARKMLLEKTPSGSRGSQFDEFCQESADKDIQSDIFSSTVTSTIASQETWTRSILMPFHVEPQNGSLNPGKSMECTITFAPTEVYNYKVILIAVIPHLNPHAEQPKIVVKGRSLMPFCHFKLEESDYVTSGRRDLTLPGPIGLSAGSPLDIQTKVVEFKVVGIGDTHSEKFIAINPTQITYRFQWENVTTYVSQSVSMFYCTSPKGSIESGSEYIMSFNFIACDVGVYESFWNFIIPEHDIRMLFLIVAHVSEPSACFLTSHLILCPTIVGLSTEKFVSLISHEDTTLNYEFEHDSIFTEGQVERLKVVPMKGKINPGEEALIHIKFTPKHPNTSHFELKCQIKGMKKPLLLSVTGECYGVQPIVTYEYQQNQIITLNPTETNIIDFGEVCVKYPQNITFRVTNIGKVTFYYFWDYDESVMKKNKIKVSFQDRGGHVTSQSRATSTMTWMFVTKNEFIEMNLVLQIKKGPEYQILMKGKSTKPNYLIAPRECNFGLCFYKETVEFSYKKILNVKNNDFKPILIECPHTSSAYLTIENGNGPIFPNEVKEILVILTPQGIMKYDVNVEFIINGCFRETIKIIGESIDLQVGLQNPQNKLTIIPPVLPGCTGYVNIPVTNTGKAEVVVQFGFGPNMLDVVSACGCEYESPLQDQCAEASLAEVCSLIHNNDLELTPNGPVALKSSGVVNIGVSFSPMNRMKMFSRKVFMKIFHHESPLCIVQGSCVGPEFSFDRFCIPFGAVIEGCTASQKVKLLNSGEVGARFEWRPGDWSRVFSIDPLKGYSSPDTETTFTIQLCSKNLQRNIHHEVVCMIGEDILLTLSLTGTCSEPPIPRESILFTTAVRTQEKQTLSLANQTGVPWNIFPRITGKYFHGPENVQVEPYSTVPYEIIYSPLVMTGAEKHMGTAIFCIPEGQALAFSLMGCALGPISSGKIVRDIPCKEKHTESLKVLNWLTTSQRFHVTNEVAKPEKIDPIFFLSGNEYIDVPGKSTRDYKWNFFCYKECSLNIKVFFTNISTKEYTFYDMSIKVVKRGPLQVIELSSRVRQPVTSKITLENPLNTDVNFSLNCGSNEIFFFSPVLVEAFTEKSIEFEYIPLFVGESSVILDANNIELGSFPYELRLTALPPLPEKLIKSTACIGSSSTMEAIVQNTTKLKTEFNIKIDNRDFDAEKNIQVAPHSTGIIVITFQPTSEGNISATLRAVSPTAGTFEFPLLGIGIRPHPQGPFTVKHGTQTIIYFKNVFFDTLPISMSVDSSHFILKSQSENIKPQKEGRIIVSMAKTAPLDATGKLTISCHETRVPNLKWVYYLKGSEN